MEITKHNFYEELDDIIKTINEASFLAFDGEFTGLSATSGRQAAPFDTPEERYDKIRNAASDFLLVQVGLCVFKADEEKQRYEARPYNFHIFPHSSGRNGPDKRFMCQSSSIDFLVSHGFDFNKIFKEGIPYLTCDEEAKLRANLEKKQANFSLMSPDGESKKTLIPVQDEHKTFIEDVCEKVKTFLEGDQNDPVKFPPCNAFLRRLMYETVQSKFPDIHMETKTGEKKERYIEISKAKDANEMVRLTMEKQAMNMMELDMQVGFSKVMQAITESGKLLVGHNMFLDVIHCLTHFYGPLPDNVDGFKDMVNSAFPKLLDTKLMANTNPFKEYFSGSSVEELHAATQLSPFTPAKVDLAEGFEKYAEEGKFHEAGYDSFITGFNFASMVNFLGAYHDPPVKFVSPDHSSIQPFVNKLFLMRIADIPYLNLAGPDAEGNRDHVLHVTFPPEWKMSDLHQLFQPYGNIHISWLTNNSAYVGLMKKDNGKIALSALQSDGSTFQVISYASFRQEQAHKAKVVAVSTPPAPAPAMNAGHKKAGVKRKSSGTDVPYPPPKLERRSITKDIKPQPSIPEIEENSDGFPSPVSESESTLTGPDISGGKTKAATGANKLFEESDQW